MKLQELEALANEICEEQQTKREKMVRLIRAYARIINAREPKRFARHACHYGDEEGCCDGSFPPKQKYSDHSGPRLIEIVDSSTEDVPTESGFYYNYRTVTTDPGLFVACDGGLVGCDMTGTGSFGSFPAHPGDCNIDCTLEYRHLGQDEIPFDRLQKAESELRKLAFPLIAARQAAA